MPWAAIIPAVASLGSAAIGAATSAGSQAQQQQQIQQEINQFMSIGVPPAAATQMVMQKYQSAGQLTPQLEQTISQAATNLNNVQTNPKDTEAQQNALSSLQNIGSSGGMTLADQANQNTLLSNTATKARGDEQAILANANARGQLGSGQALGAQLGASQNAYNQANQNSLQIAGNAQNRALQALQGAGQLGGQMQAQDYYQKANAAQAQDSISRFNAANSQNVAGRNTAYQNAANQYNLSNNQNISNANTTGQNATNQYNAQQIQNNYENQLQRAAGASGQIGNMANFYGKQGEQNSNMWGGIGSGISQAGTSYMNYDLLNNYLNGRKNNGTGGGGTSWAGDDSNAYQNLS